MPKISDNNLVISIHALREEGDPVDDAGELQDDISIHALREEGDLPLLACCRR